MAESQATKRDRFARMFPPRIEKLVDQFRMIGNCSSKSNYDYDKEKVALVWIHVIDAMMAAGEKYGLAFDFTINGKTLSELRDEGGVQSLLKDPGALL